MRPGNVRVRALIDFTDRRVGSAIAGSHFVCSDSEARRLVAEGKVEIPASKIVPRPVRPQAAPGKGDPGRPESAEEGPSAPPGDTPAPTPGPGAARPWPFSGAARASPGKPSKRRGGDADG
jgi:hypothetical protein